jgi:hypothetical protein
MRIYGPLGPEAQPDTFGARPSRRNENRLAPPSHRACSARSWRLHSQPGLPGQERKQRGRLDRAEQDGIGFARDRPARPVTLHRERVRPGAVTRGRLDRNATEFAREHTGRVADQTARQARLAGETQCTPAQMMARFAWTTNGTETKPDTQRVRPKRKWHG